MTRAQQVALQGYFRTCRHAMNLDHWTLVIPRKLTKRGRQGYTLTTTGRWAAHIQVGPVFFLQPPATQRQTVCHELLHLVHAAVLDEVRVGKYADQLSTPTHEYLYANVMRHTEYMVDHLADLLAPQLPLPPRKLRVRRGKT